MSTIFISYNRRSEEVTKTLVGDLEKLGHRAWFDQDLTGGQAWWDLILQRIRECDLFVLVLDEKSLASTACQREYGYAADLGKSILPILVADGISANLLPPKLSQTQFVDYRGQDRDAVLRLARAVTSMPPPRPLPDPLPASPEVPISYLGQVGQQIESTASLSYENQSALVTDLRRSLRDPESAKDARTLLERLRKRRDLFATIAEEIDELLGIRRTGGSKRPSGPAPGPVDVAERPTDGLQGGAAPPPPKPQPVLAKPDRPADAAPKQAPPVGSVPRYPSHELQSGTDPRLPGQKPAQAGEIAPTGGAAVSGGQPLGMALSMTRGARWKAAAVGAALGLAFGYPAFKSVWGATEVVFFSLLPGAVGAIAGALVGMRRRGLVMVSLGAASFWILVVIAGEASDGIKPFPAGGVFGAPIGMILGALAELWLRRRERSTRP